MFLKFALTDKFAAGSFHSSLEGRERKMKKMLTRD
jgi:hypothetical protein